MIEIIPDKPEITDELAMSAVKVVSDYCDNQKDCYKCGLRDICNEHFEDAPYDWEL